MELQRNSYKRRGDVIVSLNRAKVRVLLVVFSGLLLLVFLLGYLVGRVSGGTDTQPAPAPPPVTSAPLTPLGEEPAPEPEAPQDAATPAAPAPVKPAARPASKPVTTTVPRGTRYAIVIRSISLANPQLAKEEADRVIAQLKTKGFRNAHYEKITVPNKGTFYRVIATEATYPSIAVAKRDIEAMKRRGEITTGWAVPLED